MSVHRVPRGLRALVLIACGALVGALLAPVGAASSAAAAAAVDFGYADAAAVEEFNGAPLTFVGDTPGDTLLDLYVGLASDESALEARALAVSDPASAQYGTQRSVAAEAAALNASDATVAGVLEWFADRGVTLTVDPTRSYAQGPVPVAVAEEAFVTDFGTYTSGADGTLAGTNVVPKTAPGLAAGLVGLIDGVYGLVANTPPPSATSVTTGQPMAPSAVPAAATVIDGGDPLRTGTFEGCSAAESLELGGKPIGLSPAQIRAAYGIDELWDVGYRGQGARVAVVDMLEGTVLESDLAAFRTCFGLPDPGIVRHEFAGHGAAADDEATLDLELMTAVVPEAERFDWFTVPDEDDSVVVSNFLDMLVAPLDASKTGGEKPDVVSVSFGMCETALISADPAASVGGELVDQVLATAAASGIGYYVASFDNGSSGCWRFYGDGAVKTAAAVTWPATSPWVTAVGGTNLALEDDNSIASSGVWNDTAFGLPADATGGGGGGISQLEERPAWQEGASVPAGSMRMVPDVSAFADSYPGYVIHLDGTYNVFGGTSASTPVTAGAFALLQSVADATGQPRIGFSAPLLYSLAHTDFGTGGPFYDIELGTNDVYGIGVYPALTGFDLATGWGSLLHDRLADALMAPSAPVGGQALSAAVTTTPRTYRFTADPVVRGGVATSYAWDLDGDGAVDRTTSEPTVEHTYAVLGAHVASVTVTTSLGRSAAFSTTVEVADAVVPAFTG